MAQLITQLSKNMWKWQVHGCVILMFIEFENSVSEDDRFIFKFQCIATSSQTNEVAAAYGCWSGLTCTTVIITRAD